MKSLTVLLLISLNAHAGFYADIGGGFIEEMAITDTSPPILLFSRPDRSVTMKISGKLPIKSPFMLGSFGYKKKGYHIEFNRFGVLDNSNESISTIRIYKRFHF